MRAGASAASRTSARMARVSRQLRGPFGQMLMEEMAKSGAIQDPSEMFLDHHPPDLIGDSQEAAQGPVIFHQRTRSSPSKLMDFSGAMSGTTPVSDHNFAALSRDKLTVAQELLVPRTSGSVVMKTGANTVTMVPHFNDSFRRQKVGLSISCDSHQFLLSSLPLNESSALDSALKLFDTCFHPQSFESIEPLSISLLCLSEQENICVETFEK